MIRMTGLIRAFGLVAAVLLGMAGPASAGDVPLPHPAKAFKGDKCVEPSDVMRRQHMNYLKHQRDETLREGIRGEKYSLKDCVDCHAVAQPDIAGGKVRTLKPFCAQCHSYAAVHIDCFECHNPTAPLGPKTSLVVPKLGETMLSEAIKAHLGERESGQ